MKRWVAVFFLVLSCCAVSADVQLIEGDILVQVPSSREQGALVSFGALRWPAGVVPYVLDEDLPVRSQLAVLEAMAMWEAGTPVRFVPRTPENQADYPDYVHVRFQSKSTCASFVGRQGGMQDVRLAARCGTMEVAHELGHVLGLWHEQSRVDRDAYLEVCWQNVRDKHKHNFEKHWIDGNALGPYDYNSIMHYSNFAFSKNGKPTLVPRVAGAVIGQRAYLSDGDLVAVNFLYS